MISAPIFIVADDVDDHDLIREIMNELKYTNEVKCFYNAEQLIKEMRDENSIPLFILCDVSLPKIDGFELKQKIDRDKFLKSKSIPFIYWSNLASNIQIQKAYDVGGHGFFIKESSLIETRAMLKEIIQYWFRSKVPIYEAF